LKFLFIKNIRNSTIILILFCLANNNILKAQAQFQGINHPLTSRGWAMGAAVSTISQDGSGIISNPANLDLAPRSWQINYTGFVLDINSTSSYGIFDYGKHNSIGVAITALDYGQFTERDVEGNVLGNFQASDQYFSLIFGRSLYNKISVGISGSFMNSSLNTKNAKALVGTIGIKYFNPETNFALGLSYRSAGKFFSGYILDNEKMESLITFGVSKRLAHLPLLISADAYKAYDDEYIGKFGGEFHIGQRFFLRLGTSTRRFQIQSRQNLNSFLSASSIGIGISMQKFNFDLAFISLGDGGNISSYSISGKF